MVVRLAQGLSGGSGALCDAVVLDVVTDSNRASYVGLVNAFKGVAFILGPGISGILTYLGVAQRTIFLISGFLALFSAVISLIFLPETLPESLRRPLAQS